MSVDLAGDEQEDFEEPSAEGAEARFTMYEEEQTELDAQVLKNQKLVYDQLVKGSDAIFSQDEDAIQEQWWGDLVLTFRRAVAFTKRISNDGV
jgi:hypothetical protein